MKILILILVVLAAMNALTLLARKFIPWFARVARNAFNNMPAEVQARQQAQIQDMEKLAAAVALVPAKWAKRGLVIDLGLAIVLALFMVAC